MSCRREETAAAQRQAAKTAREKAAAAKKQSAEDKKTPGEGASVGEGVGASALESDTLSLEASDQEHRKRKADGRSLGKKNERA